MNLDVARFIIIVAVLSAFPERSAAQTKFLDYQLGSFSGTSQIRKSSGDNLIVTNWTVTNERYSDPLFGDSVKQTIKATVSNVSTCDVAYVSDLAYSSKGILLLPYGGSDPTSTYPGHLWPQTGITGDPTMLIYIRGGESIENTTIHVSPSFQPNDPGLPVWGIFPNIAIPTTTNEGYQSGWGSDGSVPLPWITVDGDMTVFGWDDSISCHPSQADYAPSISSFTANPSTISIGQSTTLSWVVNTTSTDIGIDNGIGRVPANGSLQISPAATTTYTLSIMLQGPDGKAYGAAKSVTVTVTAAIGGPPNIQSFTATPPTISIGDKSTLSWSVANATTVSIDNGVGSLETNAGSVNVTPSTTTTYTLTATNSSGSVTATTQVNVTPQSSTGAPTISSFTASPTSISAGQSLTLSWSANNATNVGIVQVADSGPIFSANQPNGSVSVHPTFSTKYILTASNSSGTVSKTISVVVTGTPVGQVVSQIADGGSWQSSIVLTNMGSQSATYDLQLVDEQGFALPLLGGGPLSSATGTIAPGGLAVVNTLGSSGGDVAIGWVRLVAPPAVAGFAVFRQRITGRPDFEAAVPFAQLFQTSAIPFDNTGGFSTGIAVASPSGPSVVTLTFYDEGGNKILTDTLSLGSMSHTSFDIATQYASTNGKRGMVELQSSSGIGVLGLRFNPSGPFTSMTPFPAGIGMCLAGFSCAESKAIAQLADGGSWETQLISANPSANAGNYLLSFFADNGAALPLALDTGANVSFASGIIPPGHTSFLKSRGLSGTDTTTGWGTFSADSGVGGLAVFRQSIAGHPDFEATVPYAPALTGAAIPFDNTGGFSTGLAIANAASSPATVALKLLDESGQTFAVDNLSFGPRTHTSFSLPTKYILSNGRRGVILLTTSSVEGFSAIGLRFNPTGPFTTLPTLPLPGSQSGTPDPTIISFTSAPSSPLLGQLVTLTWVTQNATSVTLTPITPNGSNPPLSQPLDGSFQFVYLNAITYRLTATTGSLSIQRDLVFTPPAPQAGQLDVNTGIAQGRIRVTQQPDWDIGGLAAVFDNDLTTLARTANENPLVIELQFSVAIQLNEVDVYMSYGNVNCKIEIATTQGGPFQQVTSGAVAVPAPPATGLFTYKLPGSFPLTVGAIRLTLQKTVGDNYVHLNEFKIFATSNLPIF